MNQHFGYSRPRQMQPTTQATLRIGATIGVPEVLRSLGVDPAKMLSEVGLDLTLFDDPSNRISFLARGRMMAHCAERTACPHFGLLVGQKAGLLSFGFVGLLAKHSPNVGLALNSLVRYMYLHVRGATTTVAVDSDQAVLEYQIYQTEALGNEQVGAGAVAVAFNLVRDLCGDDWQPIEVRFAHRKPENVTPYQQFFQVPLRFDAAQYAVVFSASWLGRRLPDNNPELLHLLQQEIDKLEVRLGDNFQDQVRSLLRTTLVTGHSSANQVAELFSMHRRTLNRRLNASGTSFRKLADEVRFEIALQLLEDSSIEIVRIASILGYSNASAFTRSFKRWSSTTPAKWRLKAKV
ncbi:AraC family transcriptional regulator [Pseudomonadota bacterium]